MTAILPGATLEMPLASTAILTITGRDAAEGVVELDSQRFHASDDGVFTVERFGVGITSSSVDNPTRITTDADHRLVTGDVVIIDGHSGSTPDINGKWTATVIADDAFTIPVEVTVGGSGGVMQDPDSVVITPVAIGEAKLRVGVDGDPGAGVVFLEENFNVLVYAIAVSLRITFQVEGGPPRPLFDGITLPMGKTAVVRMVGLDASGNQAPIADQLIEGGGAKFTVSPTTPPDPNAALLTPIATGNAALTVSADGDSGPGTNPLSYGATVSVSVGVATHLTNEYELLIAP